MRPGLILTRCALFAPELGGRLKYAIETIGANASRKHHGECLFFFFLIKKSQKEGISSVQSLSRVRLFATLWTAAHQASLSITKSRSLLKLMSIESVMPSNYLMLCRPLLLLPSIFPSIRVFFHIRFFASGGQSIGASASA